MQGLSKAIARGVDAVAEKFNLPREEAHRTYANAFREVMLEYGCEGPTYDEWRAEKKKNTEDLNYKINK